MTSPPLYAQILVVGGGPAGSYAATALAREGFQVVLFEAAAFPRYHIGESLIPAVRHHLRFIDAEQKIIDAGFAHKPGAAMKFTQHKHEGYTDFVALGAGNSTWNVCRADFDALLLDHAQEQGVSVFQSTKVTSIAFNDDGRPVSATYTTPIGTQDVVDNQQMITFDYLVDASGRAGLLSNNYFKTRRYNSSLRNIATWGYWRGAGVYGRGTPTEGAPWFEALTDESGWAWFIPLAGGITSVGIVRSQRASSRSRLSMRHRYLSSLNLAPGLRALLGDQAELIPGGLPTRVSGASEPGVAASSDTTIRSASDFSYSSSSYAGPGYRIVGDAGAFIDPFFSSGVHLAVNSALSAATSIAASIRGDCGEKDACDWHTERVTVSYTRFLVVVLSAYKQMRSQSQDVLTDVGEDSFDNAFKALRPIIHGNADVGPRLSEEEVQRALDFCSDLFTPTSPEQHAAARARVRRSDALFDIRAPVLTPRALDAAVATLLPAANVSGVAGEEEVRRVLGKINARRIIHRDFGGMHSLEEETLGSGVGWRVRLERGQLGLVRAHPITDKSKD
ncbi:hypothetical protein K488DRAFT_81076 [Vararia minispora EC-137]|uniref:Uncharacterized protein n=1 Tax=Vararia minispora EC-137 TaxID=1314806 RepID=A0ACB8Q6U4_9AGAM|nr:hypothetical protein K488DRAFT_81076 [Vararia minispora EC-137]